jgi:hypothetical protein
MAKQLRRALEADARNEFEEQGTVPTWRLPGITVSGSTTHPTVVVSDEKAFLAWAKRYHPNEVETVTFERVKPQWQAPFLKGVASRGLPMVDKDGVEVEGLTYRPGGDFDGIALKVDSDVKEMLADYAAEIAAGIRPLALPPVVAGVPA